MGSGREGCGAWDSNSVEKNILGSDTRRLVFYKTVDDWDDEPSPAVGHVQDVCLSLFKSMQTVPKYLHSLEASTSFKIIFLS